MTQLRWTWDSGQTKNTRLTPPNAWIALASIIAKREHFLDAFARANHDRVRMKRNPIPVVIRPASHTQLNPKTKSKMKIPRISVITLTAVLALTFLSPAIAAVQDQWRYCRKCHVMFYDGYPNKGRCAAGGGHFAQGFNFLLPYNVAETRQAQGAWRYCGKCHAMFFDGYPQKGACAAGGGHAAQGYLFVLPHDVPPRGVVQNAWRYCEKCHAMFYDGYANKGRCPAVGGHRAEGYNFVLRYRGNLENDVQLNPVHE